MSDIVQDNLGEGSCSTESSSEPPKEPKALRKIFIGGLNYSTTEETLKEHFAPFGQLLDCVVIKFPDTKRSRGFGFIEYAKSEQVDACQAGRPHVLDGKQVETKRATPRDEFSKPEAGQTVKKLFVGGLKDDVEDADMQEYFGQFGNLLSVTRMTEKETGKKRGFGFVEYDDYDSVDRVILKREHQIKGKRVDVKKALSKSEMSNIQARQGWNLNNNQGWEGAQAGYGGGGGGQVGWDQYAGGWGGGYGNFGGQGGGGPMRSVGRGGGRGNPYYGHQGGGRGWN